MNEVTSKLNISIATTAAVLTGIASACLVRAVATSVAVTNFKNESVVGDQVVQPTETKTNAAENEASAAKSDSALANEEVSAQKGGVKAANIDAKATEAETKAAAVDTAALKTGAGALETGTQIMKLN